MFSGAKIFLAGMIISFLGSLPLGTLNITAMQIAVQETVRKALVFALGVALVELIYVRISLKGIDFILANQHIFHALEWATVVLFLVLATSSFYTAAKPAAKQKNILLNNSLNRFWLGLSMSAINPVQIPFWFLWSSYLFSIQLLQSTSFAFNVYTLGIATGTILGLLLFIYGGKWLVNRLHTGQKLLNIFVGIVFLVSAVIQLVRVISKPMEKRLKTTVIRTVHLHPHSAYSAFRP
ncbi:LysE family translocator [Flavihumibacter fluvii]|uniref:LysE family translocator n=1 Tax=Flavihumibacter fluvii TaxID=2838157 RepID=UPI001BDF19E1|nr:LysE family transporter [Flavihumibacter fluvii]ULQ54367.1 LysE family transporter [Flavihumibacter fluvii]